MTKVRASQRNGCTFCVKFHLKASWQPLTTVATISYLGRVAMAYRFTHRRYHKTRRRSRARRPRWCNYFFNCVDENRFFTANGATSFFWLIALKKGWFSVLLSNPFSKTFFCTSSCSALCNTLNCSSPQPVREGAQRREFWQVGDVSTR